MRLVRDGIYGRFRRDPIVVQAQDSKISIEHPKETGTFLTRDYSPAELQQVAPEVLAEGLLLAYASEEKRSALLAYAKAQFPSAADIRPLDDDFDREVVGIVQLKFHGARLSAGFSRELWDDAENFEQLRAHMERHRWRETVNSTPPTKRAILGRNGWLDEG